MAEMSHAVEAPHTEVHDHSQGAILRFIVIALTAFLTVVDLFATQAILPSLARHYGVMPAAIGFAVNASTMGMAVAGLAVGYFSSSIDRRLGILISLVVLAVPTAMLAHAPDLTTFTILRVAQAIVDRQRHFLEHGEVAMRPLVLREIAGTLGLHESTISRVTTQKFMATPRGTFELKYFFGSHVATEAGGAASSTAIRALIKQLVSAEDAKAPLSDARISQILGEQGIVVARRTIAKYRESLQIPPVNQRKAL